MENLLNLEGYLNVLIIACCLLVGFILKMWIKDVDNKYIPTVVAILGVILAFITNGISIDAFVVGGFSGLASTGLHQLVKQLMKSDK
ncbi:MAG: phage holin family protein [Anaerorhabdus sp.]